jgi:hypothetical protein
MQIQGLRAYLISRSELAPDWLILYAATFAIQLLCASLRGGVAYIALWVLFKLARQPTVYLHTIVVLIAYGPLALSLLTLILPFAGSWPPAHTKARYPTQTEQDLYLRALAQIRRADPYLRTPRRWYVQDSEQESASAYADSLLVNSGLLEHENATPLLAQALAHLNSSDARLTAALQRLTLPLPATIPRGLATICALASGNAAMWPLKGSWAAYWRTREHHARQHAEQLLAGSEQPSAQPHSPPPTRAQIGPQTALADLKGE